MPQQRIHVSTYMKAKKLKDMINEERTRLGLKKVTIPDIFESSLEIMMDMRPKENKQIKEQTK